MANGQNTAEKIIDVAQELVQLRGYHAFSYRDVSDRIGIKTASIHYYYPSKPDLALAMLQRVRSQFESALVEIDQAGLSTVEKLESFTGIFVETYGTEGALCPFCMIAMSQETVPDAVQQEVRRFWLSAEVWLNALLTEGSKTGEFVLYASSSEISRMMVASLEGTMIVAKAFDDRSRLLTTAQLLMNMLRVQH